MKRISIITVLFIHASVLSPAQTVKILFDAMKAQSAGNADWILDADTYNLKWNPNANPNNGGNESNAQITPTPAQSGITSSTPETYWDGSLSNWGIDCVKAGWQVETLPYNGSITYGSSSNSQDLSNYKVFVSCEPNIKYTTAEKTAILSFIQNGGGFFMIADHANSDRNNDNWDSPQIFNDLMSANPFGIKFDSVDITENPSNMASITSDTILNGPYGNVNLMNLHNSSTMTITPSANANVKGLVFRNGYSNTGNNQVIVARSRYGNGKVVALTDSSPPDDGTGDPNDNLYNGYTGEANGNHRKLIMNATYWLVNTTSISTGINEQDEELDVNIFPNPTSHSLHVSCKEESEIRLFNLTGQPLITMTGKNVELNTSSLMSGIYYLHIKNDHQFLVKSITCIHE